MMRSVNLKVKHEHRVTVELLGSEVLEIVREHVKSLPGWPKGEEPQVYHLEGEMPISMPSLTFESVKAAERDSAPPKPELPRGPTPAEYALQAGSGHTGGNLGK